MCECIDRVQASLKQANMPGLSFTIPLRAGVVSRVVLEQAKREKGQKKGCLLASYCPFCGEQYQDATEGQAESRPINQGEEAASDARSGDSLG